MGIARIQPGVEIAYRLRPSDRPKNPQRLWHARVEEVYNGACRVRLTEPEYEGLDEMIFFEQIVSIGCLSCCEFVYLNTIPEASLTVPYPLGILWTIVSSLLSSLNS